MILALSGAGGLVIRKGQNGHLINFEQEKIFQTVDPTLKRIVVLIFNLEFITIWQDTHFYSRFPYKWFPFF